MDGDWDATMLVFLVSHWVLQEKRRDGTCEQEIY